MPHGHTREATRRGPSGGARYNRPMERRPDNSPAKPAARAGRALAAAALALALASCGTPAPSQPADLSAYLQADMTGFSGFEVSSVSSVQFVDVTVQDVAQLMEAGESFILYCAYPGCPWCAAVSPVLNEVAAERGVKVCLLNTRKDPSWQTNMDIDDYDLFVELFGEWLDEDENGDPHLYVPDLYVVSGGKVAANHAGVIEGYDDPAQPMTDEQRDALADLLGTFFDMM